MNWGVTNEEWVKHIVYLNGLEHSTNSSSPITNESFEMIHFGALLDFKIFERIGVCMRLCLTLISNKNANEILRVF